MQDFEKLGVFYLGRSFDVAAKQPGDELVLYDSKDLVTHAVCVGMTGSGKTGLCIGLLEEAAIDGIPAIVVDFKGDLVNLLLAFPQLRGADFAPWVDPEAARKLELSREAFAEQEAAKWKAGIAGFGQDGARIGRMLQACDFALYTPGSNAGIPVSILGSLAAPPAAIAEDAELFQERIRSTATSTLGLIGIDADPLQSREHILLSTILAQVWKAGRDLDLAQLIEAIQKPPVQRMGVIDLESFYPAKERFELAMRINNLLATPSFASWIEGEALDIQAALYTPAGKPRIAIFSIAHLSDRERMFFVSLLLNQLLGWVRTQHGTDSLRALLYIDEIFGYMPPVANPPSKQPLLTLLTQSRAFGLGIVLATQNPVDLDYKGLSNAGTWFIGRLQTDRDKQRLLDGLESALASSSASFDRARIEATLASLPQRVFLMNNVHDDRPIVFQTRFTLSYLRGPMTRAEIRLLSGRARAATVATPAAPATPTPAPPAQPAAAAVGASAVAQRSAAPPAPEANSARPALPQSVPQRFLAPNKPAAPAATLVWKPALLGAASIYFRDARLGVEAQTSRSVLLELAEGCKSIAWEDAQRIETHDDLRETEPDGAASFAPVPAIASDPKLYSGAQRTLAAALYRTEALELFYSTAFDVVSRPFESERDFRIRLQQLAREQRDEQAARLRQKYAPKVATLTDRRRRALQAVEREAEQARQSKLSTMVSLGATLLGAFTGRKALSAGTISRAGSTARGVGRSMKDSKDVSQARQTADDVQAKLDALDDEFKAELAELEQRLDPVTEDFETKTVRPKKTDVEVRLITLCWIPSWQTADGKLTRAWS